jgi:Tol biopolymer transport system component
VEEFVQEQFSSRQDSWVPARILYAALLLVGLVGLVSSGLQQERRFAPLQPAVTAFSQRAGGRALTSGKVMDGFGAWSPTGQEIAFMRNGRIWVIPAAGGKAVQLTHGDGRWDAVPTWRPDSPNELAFIRLPVNGGEAKVMLLNRQTGAERELASEPTTVGYLAWSPDGKTLFYTTPEMIYRLDPATGTRSAFLKIKEGWELTAGGVAVSPDGKLLVFGAGPRLGRGVRYNLYGVRLDVPEIHPEALTTEGGIMPAFAPLKDRFLIAYRNPITKTGIYLMSLPDHQTTPLLLDDAKGMFFHPNWSPDAKELVVSRLALDVPPPAEGPGFISHLYRIPVRRDSAGGGED